jgi:hypothetical protein
MEPVKANTLNLFTLPSSVQKDILDALEASNLILPDPTTGERLVGAKREAGALRAPYVELHCASLRMLEQLDRIVVRIFDGQRYGSGLPNKSPLPSLLIQLRNYSVFLSIFRYSLVRFRIMDSTRKVSSAVTCESVSH